MEKKNKKTRYLVLYTLVIIMVFVAMFTINQAERQKEKANPITSESPSTEGQPVLGDNHSKVSIVEFGDYKCPSCKVWGEKIWPQLQKDYIDSGKATFSYINVLFHGEESILGAKASEAIYKSNPEEFWAFHKALFDAQPESASHDELWLTNAKVLEVAKAAVPSLDVEQFRTHIQSSEVQAMVEQDKQLVEQFHIQQTPTIIINNVVISNPFDYNAIKSAIEQEMESF